MTTNRTVLISGASVAGPALAYWLRRYGFEPTIVEKADAVRGGGYPIDLRGVAVDVIERMGLLEPVRAAHIATERVTVVGDDGRRIGGMAIEDFAANRDLELPRGRLTELLYEQTRDDVEYVFGDSIAGLEQNPDGVRVTFRSGAERTFGLVIGTDGLHSNVRGQVFGPEKPFHRYLGHYFMGFSMPDRLGLDSEVVMHNSPGRMAAAYAVRGMDHLNVLLAFAVPEQRYERMDTEQQLEAVERAFAHDGWEVPRLLRAMREADDLFFDSVSQIRMPAWFRGRVALAGDAAYAPSFLSGQGTSLAVVGAYVLAGELSRAGGDHRVAFPTYESVLRPFVAANQKLALRGSGAMIPKSRAGLWSRNRALGLVPLLDKLPVRLDGGVQRAANGLTLTEYRALDTVR